ncbi:hypothetical protein AMECASPLE_036165 [Ameca splendens]|uniref:Uncharacterized protein n=1 Tax=Ameca splendens TaxID=208324 RepID=A0ABV1A622_9TELE
MDASVPTHAAEGLLDASAPAFAECLLLDAAAPASAEGLLNASAWVHMDQPSPLLQSSLDQPSISFTLPLVPEFHGVFKDKPPQSPDSVPGFHEGFEDKPPRSPGPKFRQGFEDELPLTPDPEFLHHSPGPCQGFKFL